MHSAELTVHVIDDDRSVRESLAAMLGVAGYRTMLFPDAESFLAAHDERWAGCLLVDLRLPGKSGIELQAELEGRAVGLAAAVAGPPDP